MTTTQTTTKYADCQTCGSLHVAEYSHEGQWGQGPIYAVVCPEGNLVDYYTTEGLSADSLPKITLDLAF